MKLRKDEARGEGGALPLILTLAMEEEALARFNALRLRHFPPERNHIPAHLTLFHQLPGQYCFAVRARVADMAALQRPFSLKVTAVAFMGRGVAYRLEKGLLADLRAEIGRPFRAQLGAQDLSGFTPHITVQNKVEPAEARALHGALSRDFEPFPVRFVGLDLWRYQGGPWERLDHFPFVAGA